MSRSYFPVIRFIVSAWFAALLSLQPLYADEGGKLSKKEAIREAQKRNGGGKVLGITERDKNGKRSFQVKLISEGKVRVFNINEE